MNNSEWVEEMLLTKISKELYVRGKENEWTKIPPNFFFAQVTGWTMV